MVEYDSYEAEPEESFLELTPALYSQFYDLELAEFSADLAFYRRHLPSPSTLLEVGCGTGRLTSLLATDGHHLIGIDLSAEMLAIARQRCRGTSALLQMDMRHLAFRQAFSAVIIGYNTLNLLPPEDIATTLEGCRRVLQPGGLLLLQLYVPDAGWHHERTMQFQLFDRPGGGKVVKETIRQAAPGSTCSMRLTERYKVRPMNGREENGNYQRTSELTCCSPATWLATLGNCGFTVLHTSRSYTEETTGSLPTSFLLLAARTNH